MVLLNGLVYLYEGMNTLGLFNDYFSTYTIICSEKCLKKLRVGGCVVSQYKKNCSTVLHVKKFEQRCKAVEKYSKEKYDVITK